MGRLKKTISEICLNREIKHWRKIERRKIDRISEQAIVKNSLLSKDEKNAIDSFFLKATSRKIDYFWHSKYKAVSGVFCIDYFPDLYYNADLKHLLNDKFYTEVYGNKIVTQKIVSGSNIGVKTPTNILYCNNGILFDKNNKQISLNEGKCILQNARNVFAKKTIGTYGGDGCKMYNRLSNTDIEYLLNSYGSNYSIQEIIKNQSDIAKLNPNTLNTFRIITFYADGCFHASPLVLRIGRATSYLDNAHAGGMFVGVDDNGTIISDATNVRGEKFQYHPDTKIRFKGYKIKNVPLLIEKAVQLASLFPQTKLIDWDLAIDKDGNIVCIEANIDSGSIWLMQMTHGKPVFGEYTKQMLSFVRFESLFSIVKRNINS